MQTAENVAYCGTQNGIAKSIKAVLIRRIARLVRQEGLDYEGWRYIANLTEGARLALREHPE